MCFQNLEKRASGPVQLASESPLLGFVHPLVIERKYELARQERTGSLHSRTQNPKQTCIITFPTSFYSHNK